jgi:pilus assembly protein Flp/PilA
MQLVKGAWHCSTAVETDPLLLVQDQLQPQPCQRFGNHNALKNSETNSSSCSLRRLQPVWTKLHIPTGTEDRRLAEETDTQESHMKNLVAKFAKDESGATAIEYGLIAALIAVAMIVGARMVGVAVNTKFEEVADEINGA